MGRITRTTGIDSVSVKLRSGTEFTYYPGRGQVQVLVIAQDGFMFKEAAVDVERFIELIEKMTAEKDSAEV